MVATAAGFPLISTLLLLPLLAALLIWLFPGQRPARAIALGATLLDLFLAVRLLPCIGSTPRIRASSWLSRRYGFQR
jgi:NADH:ubiquinone oxidoreductase subunit 4 (subunit M)